MTNEQFRRELDFAAALHIAKNMLALGLITEREFLKMRQKLAEKYSPIIGALRSNTA
jgi:hypothetical protein